MKPLSIFEFKDILDNHHHRYKNFLNTNAEFKPILIEETLLEEVDPSIYGYPTNIDYFNAQ